MIKKIIYKLNDEKNRFNKLLPFFILLLFIIVNITIINNIYTKDFKNSNLFRLHIVANSNSLEDQIIKLKVNEKITNYIDNLSKQENISINNIKDNIEEILTISNNTLKQNNIPYNASLKLGKINYEKKQSIILDMENGRYESIQIILGDGNGKNIWTLISPSQENLYKIKELNTILPGINSLYKFNETEKLNTKEYTFKLVELVKKII